MGSDPIKKFDGISSQKIIKTIDVDMRGENLYPEALEVRSKLKCERERLRFSVKR